MIQINVLATLFYFSTVLKNNFLYIFINIYDPYFILLYISIDFLTHNYIFIQC